MAKRGIVIIGGKEYEEVWYRVEQFRTRFPLYGISTEIITNTDYFVLAKATICDERGNLIATGHAEEVRSEKGINSTSALENAETSAVGRALGFFLYAGQGSIATADEVQRAIERSEALKNNELPTTGRNTKPITVEATIKKEPKVLETDGETISKDQLNVLIGALDPVPDMVQDILKGFQLTHLSQLKRDVFEKVLNKVNKNKANLGIVEQEWKNG